MENLFDGRVLRNRVQTKILLRLIPSGMGQSGVEFVVQNSLSRVVSLDLPPETLV